MNIRNLILINLILMTLFSCETQSEKDEEIILNYLNEHNLDATKHESGLYYIINEEGTGSNPQLSNKIEIKYKGYLIDGTIFDQTTDTTAQFYLNQLIEGWQIGIQMLKKGGKQTLFIPSELGYGEESISIIPANSVLIFDIELINFEP
jgi:FKBP-type peptidyl-prolyl cis-trans isomerase FkpA